jgi:uncharacterized Zn-binding protein involved in type VI secretion
MPPAARITDMHVCPMVTGIVPHVGGPILPPCAMTVIIGGLPAARITDMAVCLGPPDLIVMGSPTVLIEYLPAARMLDNCAHGGIIVLGCFTVIIGDSGSGGGGEEGGDAGEAAVPAPAAAGGGPAAPQPAAKPLDIPDVKNAVAKSPTLSKQLKDLQEKGWKIEFGQAGKGTFANRAEKKIVVDPDQQGHVPDMLTSLAHEAGHASREKPKYIPPGKLSKEDYVNANVKESLRDEADATINNIVVKKELKDAGGPVIEIAGAKGAQYEKIFTDNGSDPAKARDKIADEFGTENPSNDPTKTYDEYYGKPYSDYYDKQKGTSK